MPRQARKESITNIYHIMLRGINRQTIFHDNADRSFFLTVLKKYKETSGFRIHAFCLMPNHIHLLMETGEEPLETIFKRVGVSYAGWYNKKYERVGHLFQDRFRSENVETTQYYMTVLRYILQNPTKAGMEDRPGTYRWSSYLAYEKGKGSLTDTEYALEVFGSRENLIGFVQTPNKDVALDEEQFDRRLREEYEKEVMVQITGCESASEFQQLEKPVQKAFVTELYQTELSTGQISRLTGIPKTTVYRMITQDSEDQSITLHEAESFEYEINYEEIW